MIRRNIYSAEGHSRSLNDTDEDQQILCFQTHMNGTDKTDAIPSLLFFSMFRQINKTLTLLCLLKKVFSMLFSSYQYPVVLFK